MAEEQWRTRRGGVETALRTSAVWASVRTLIERQQAELGRPLRVLDLGGGTGGLAVPLAELGHDVIVVDPSPDALASLSRRSAERDVADRVTALQGDADSLADFLGDQPVDLVCCHGTLEVVDDPEATRRLCPRHLRLGLDGVRQYLLRDGTTGDRSRCCRAKSKTSLAVTRTMAYHPEVQHRIAQMVLAFDTIAPHLDQVADDWSSGVDHGATWPAKIVSAKHHAVETAWSIVDWAMDVSGGSGMFRGNELERLFRDARCGRFHPANTFLTHEVVAKTALGIDMGEQPRWG